MKPDPDLCVIGAGASGLSVAGLAAGLGAKVVLIEHGKMGGECLNSGCVPSKALLAAAKSAHAARQAKHLGVDADVAVDFARVHKHVRDTIKAIAPHDSARRFEKLGVEVLRADARFTAPGVVRAGEREIRARRVVIATGSDPMTPPVEGLRRVKFFTNETIFDNDTLPDHLAVLGGGPLGIELAQAFARLGSKVTVLEHGKAMAKDDPHFSRTLLQQLAAEKIAIHENTKVSAVEPAGDGVKLTLEEGGQKRRLTATHLLIAAGRKPRVDGLDLEAAGVAHDDKGITVDKHLRTSAKNTFALGDVIDGPRFTHAGNYQAGVVVKNALFRLTASVDYAALPWVTYTDQELAQVGMTEPQAKKAHGKGLKVLKVDYRDNDRAVAEGKPHGALKLIARADGEVLGVSILGAQAGELALLWGLVISQKLKLKAVAQLIAPYPTLSELSKSAAAEFYKPKLFGEMSHRLVRFLSWLP